MTLCLESSPTQHLLVRLESVLLVVFHRSQRFSFPDSVGMYDAENAKVDSAGIPKLLTRGFKKGAANSYYVPPS